MGSHWKRWKSECYKHFLKQLKEFEQPVIITHGGPIRFLLTKFANVEKSFWDWEVPHGSMFTVAMGD